MSFPTMSVRCLVSVGVLMVSLVAFPSASWGQSDWPQWMGPKRDNVWRTQGVVDTFPEAGLPVLWRTSVAGGYSGPAVAQGKVVLTDYLTSDNVKVDNFAREQFTGQERVLCLDATDGSLIWKHEYPVVYNISYPAGPRCTPIIDGDRVYTLGAEGNLVCFQLDDGKVIWSVDLKERYQTKAALWGYAAHPLIDGDQLLTLAGGDGSHIVSLNKRDGSENWRALSSPEQGYSPPTIIEAGGVRQLILARPDAVTSVNPANGEVYWSFPYEATSGSIIMSPVKLGNYLYVAGYSRKSLLLELATNEPAAKEVWRDKGRDAISPVNVQPFPAEGWIVGMDQSGIMCGLSIPDGERLWDTPTPVSKRAEGSGTAFIVRQDDRFWLFNELGELIIAKMDREGYQEISRTQVIEPTNLAFGRQVVWSMPAFAGQRIYIRNDKEVICLDAAK